jgi:HAD superfamily hydrolase (TIGR01509 family)
MPWANVLLRMALKAVIFDFDNTIADFKTAKDYMYRKLSRKMLEEYGIFGLTTVDVLAQIDHEYSIKGERKKPHYFSREVWAAEFFKRAGIKHTKKMCRDFEMFYWRFILEGVRPMPHAVSVLKKLRKKYKIALLSDSDGFRRFKVERAKVTGLYDLIDLFVTSDDVGQNKPSRKFYEYIFRRLKVKPAECVMVGDKPEVDLQLGKKLGMKTVWIKHGDWSKALAGKKFNYVDCEITDLRELLNIMDGLRK